jgi:hypothetical protein
MGHNNHRDYEKGRERRKTNSFFVNTATGKSDP